MEKKSGITYYQLSKQIINIFINTKKPFLVEQVHQVILFYGGILRADIGLPVKDYLRHLREEGFLSRSNEWYQATGKT